MITNMYNRTYKDGSMALRLEGIYSDTDGGFDPTDLDARSVEKMFPHVMFDIILDEDSDWDK